MQYRTVLWRSPDGAKPALLLTPERSGTLLRLLAMDYPLRVKLLPRTEERYMTSLTFRGETYPLPRMVRRLRKFAKKAGVGNRATKTFLSEAAAYVKGERSQQT